MADSKKVFKCTDVNYDKIYFDTPKQTSNNENIVSKIWYHYENNECGALNIQLPTLNIYEYNGDHVVVFLNDELVSFFDTLDAMSVEFIKSSIMPKFGIGNCTYRVIARDDPSSNEKESSYVKRVIKLRLNYSRTPVLFYTPDRKQVDAKYAHELLRSVTSVKVIVEINGIVVDLQNGIISTNVVARQVLIPISIVYNRDVLRDYSFLETECDRQDAHGDCASSDHDVVVSPVNEPVDEPVNEPVNEPVHAIRNDTSDDSSFKNNHSFDSEDGGHIEKEQVLNDVISDVEEVKPVVAKKPRAKRAAKKMMENVQAPKKKPGRPSKKTN